MLSGRKLLIINEDTAFYQLVIILLLVAGIPVIIFSLDLPWMLLAVPVWIVVAWCSIEFVIRRYYSVYIENREIILYNPFRLKAIRRSVQEFERVALHENTFEYPGYRVFLIHFKDGSKYRFIVGDGVIQLNGALGINKTDQQINTYVDGIVRSFIAGTWNGPSAPFRKNRY